MSTNPVEASNRTGDETDVAPLASQPRGRSNRTGLFVAGGIALVGCVTVAVVDPNQTQLLPACMFKSATGLDCPGCGMTRGLHALLRGDLFRALSHNLLLVALIACSAMWFGWNAFARRTGRRPLRMTTRREIWIGIGLLVVAFWVTRNLPLSPFDWLNSDA